MEELKILTDPEYLPLINHDGRLDILRRLERFLPLIEEVDLDQDIKIFNKIVNAELKVRENKEKTKYSSTPMLRWLMVGTTLSFIAFSLWRSTKT